jgi:hypothetical protein
MRLDGLQSGIAQRHARRRLLAPAHFALRDGCRGSSYRASSPPSFGCICVACSRSGTAIFSGTFRVGPGIPLSL